MKLWAFLFYMETFLKISDNKYYEISDLGRVKSIKRLVFDRLGNLNNLKKEKILKNKTVNGYKYISFKVDGKFKNFYIHRLVALAFIPNTENKPQVNHINGIKSDNRVENLEWCTPKENSQHSYDLGLSKKGDNHYLRIRKNGVKFSN